MPRFYFHVHATDVAHDEEGAELPNLAAAITSAIANARFLVAEEVRRHNSFSPNHSIAVADATGTVVQTIRYGDCIDVNL